ncbi:MAG: hypothetical protein RSD36_15795 [Terrisporobacter sp.]
MINNEFPKVLLIVKNRVNTIDSSSMAIKNWFSDWPKNSIAQIYSNDSTSTQENQFIENGYRIDSRDRNLGVFFSFFKSKTENKNIALILNKPKKKSFKENILKYFSDLIVRSGIWEIIFPPKMSDDLKKWIIEYSPDVLFVQGADISFMKLPLIINKEFNIPICFNIADDWVEHLYTNGFLSQYMMAVTRSEFNKLLNESDLNYVIGEKMKLEYIKRYNKPFSTLMQCADPQKYNIQLDNELSWKDSVIKILYSGSLALNRWKAIIDLSKAVHLLNKKGMRFEINVYSNFTPDEAVDLFMLYGVNVYPAVQDDKMPQLLAESHILFLPESFDDEYKEYIKYSVSTKCHLYMMASRIILAYGPPDVSTISYAKSDQWAVVADQQSINLLEEKLLSIFLNSELREQYLINAKNALCKNHLKEVVSKRLKNDLSTLVSKVENE